MKVLQINTVCGFGSTGRSAIELAQIAADQGNECFVAFGQGSTDYKNSYKIGTTIENHIHNVCSRLFGKQGGTIQGMALQNWSTILKESSLM